MVEDSPCSRRVSTSNIYHNVKKVKEMVLENRYTSELGIEYGTVQHIVVDILGIRRIASRFILTDLNFAQKKYAEDIICE